jgi:uncharacterized protein YecT (DUF1311 family)
MLIRTVMAGLIAAGLATSVHAATDGATDNTTIAGCLKSSGETPAKARACIDRVAGPCMKKPDGQSTPGMVDCLMTETQAWDDVLNAEYKRLLPLLNMEAAADVTKAQRLWIQAREADCQVPYYFYDGGTIVKILGAECERDHTADRAILLKSWREMAQGE